MPDCPIFDADGHVYEKDAELYDFLPPPYRGKETVLGFPFWPSLDGFHRGSIHARLDLFRSLETSAAIWLDFLDRAGIESTVLYPTAGLATGFIRDRDWAVALTRAYNDSLAERYLKASPRLRGVALLPLQDPAEAAIELRRAVTELRMLGGVLPATGLHRPLGHGDFDPLYREAERLGCVLAVHGGPSQGLGLDGLDRFAQVHTLSHPYAQMLQVTSIVMSGVLDRFPALHVAFLEAGVGWVPFLMERMDRSYEARKHPEYVGAVEHLPSTYFERGNVFFTVDPGERSLGYAAERIGTRALLFASDFPHEANLARCREEIEILATHAALDAEARADVFARNARRFYRLDATIGR